MKTDLIREIIFRAFDSKNNDIRFGELYRVFLASKRFVSREAKSSNHNDPPQKWIFENAGFLLESVQGIKKNRLEVPSYVLASIFQLIKDPSFEGMNEEIRAFFDGITSVTNCSEKTLCSVESAFYVVILVEIRRQMEADRSKIPHLITVFHRLRGLPFSQISSHFSPLDRMLRSDPDGIYSQMTRETQNQYKNSILHEAKKRKITPESLCEEKLKQARNKRIHVGFLLSSQKKNVLFFPFVILLYGFLLKELSLAVTAPVIIILSALPLYFFTHSVCRSVYASVTEAKPLPQMKVDFVDENIKTCVVITAVLGKREDVDSLEKKIKRYRANNATEDDEMYFGLILDFPESKRETEPEDVALKQYLKDKIADWNRGMERPGFFAFLRPRVYHASENRFSGYERKRGAIQQFISFLNRGILPEGVEFFGLQDELIGTRYLITLDSDTELSIFQAKRLIGMICHPMNRAKIGTRKGRKQVTSGYGILQPKISTSLLEKIKTPFGKIQGNGGGEIHYAGASFDLMQSVIGEANFCGKGIIDVNAFDEVLDHAIPEQRILSHDMPEGALLRCGLSSEETFFDSNPQTVSSFFKRQHRWIRGDVQNLRLFGKLSFPRKVFFAESILRYLIPALEFSLILIAPVYGDAASVTVCLLVLLFHFEPMLLSVLRFLTEGNWLIFGRRFSTRIRNLLLNSFYECLLSLSGIAFCTYYYLNAILRSLWRMLVSKKHFLQWQVYSPFGKKKECFLFYLPSTLLGVFSLFLCDNSLFFVFSFSWILYPFFCYYLSRPYPEYESWSESEKKYLTSLAEKEFRFFKHCVSEKTNFLPPDNLQLKPVESLAMRTSPTNIGLYLASVLASCDFGFLSIDETVKRINKTMDTVERLEHYGGHLYNWYDCKTLEVIGDHYLSLVDSGNFAASLIAVREGLLEYRMKHPDIQDLVIRLDRELDSMNFSLLFDFEQGHFLVGIQPGKSSNQIHYDMYMSEARITAFLAIGLGQIPANHWGRLSRPLLTLSGRAGVGSWSGTAFEYFMPTLFLPVIPNSMEDESLDYAYFCQEKYAAYPSASHRIFGISESGYSFTDPDGNYQYKAFGVPYTSIQNTEYAQKVISPYSSFLMLERGQREIIRNLKRMESIGLSGDFGFYEACEFHSNFLGDYSLVYSYMSHHKGMSILAISNAIFQKNFVRRFLNYRDFRYKTELLAERFPLEGRIQKKKRELKKQERSYSKQKECKTEIDVDSNRCFLISDGRNTVVVKENTEILWKLQDQTVLKFSPILKIPDFGSSELLLAPKFLTVTDQSCELFYEHEKSTVKIRVFPICGKNAIALLIGMHGIRGKIVLGMEGSLILNSEKEYRAHPAFQNLSLEGRKDDEIITIRKRTTEKHRYLHVQGKMPIRYWSKDRYVSKQTQYTLIEDGCLRIKAELEGFGHTTAPLLFSFSESEFPEDLYQIFDGSYEWTEEYRRKASETASRQAMRFDYDEECRKIEEDLLCRLMENRRFFYRSDLAAKSIDAIWKHGISGDFPILTLRPNGELSESVKRLSAFIRVVKRWNSCNLNCDLVIVQKENNEYFNPTRDKITDLIELFRAQHFVGKHPGIHVIKTDSNDEIEFLKHVSFYYEDDVEKTHRKTLESADLAICATKDPPPTNSDKVGILERGKFVWKRDPSNRSLLSYVVANRRVGFVCHQNSLGFTWVQNSALGRISVWDNVPDSSSGEKVFYENNGVCYDLLQNAYEVTYQERFAIYSGTVNRQPYRIVASVLEDLNSKWVYVQWEGSEGGNLIYSFVPAMGFGADRNILLDERENCCVLRPVIYRDINFSCHFILRNQKPIPSARENRIEFSWKISKENHLLLGGHHSEKELEFICNHFKKSEMETLIKKESQQMELILPKKFQSVQKSWAYYQASICRFFARSGWYQSGGAYGFRDQLQDSLLFLEHEPWWTKIQILRSAAHQFEDGSVLHWWHPNRRNGRYDPGIKSRCSDDYLWLLFATAEYIDVTGDTDILNLSVPFLENIVLKDGEDERYVNPKISSRKPLREHLRRAAMLFIDRGLGQNQLPPIGSGDWNDGMNQIHGESVWLGFFAAICLHKAMDFLGESDRNKIVKILDSLCAGLEASFNGVWFARAYRNDGYVFGTDVTLESECSIDLVTQAFSAFFALEFRGDPRAISDNSVLSALNAAYETLLDEKHRTIRLFRDPFINTEPSPGYVQRYCAGVRENGGQYTHAAVWFALALLEFGHATGNESFIERGIFLADLIDPTKNNDKSLYQRYQREPYVLCGDVYMARGYQGQGGWSWYTGAAAWYCKLLNRLEKLKEKRIRR